MYVKKEKQCTVGTNKEKIINSCSVCSNYRFLTYCRFDAHQPKFDLGFTKRLPLQGLDTQPQSCPIYPIILLFCTAQQIPGT